MAFRMRHWIGVVVFGCALVAIAALPPVSIMPEVKLQGTYAQARSAALSMDVGRAASILQHRRLGDSLISLTLAEPGPLVFGATSGIPAEDVTNRRDRVAKEMGEERLDENTSVALGLFLVSFKDGAYKGRVALPGAEEYFWGTRDGRAYCVGVHSTYPLADGRLRPRSISPAQDLLGVCGLIARYGLPGPTLEAWLATGGTAFAASLKPSAARPDFWGYYREVGARFGPGLTSVTSLVGSRSERDLAVTQCLAGATAGCAWMFAHSSDGVQWYGSQRDTPVAIAHSPLSAVQSYTLFSVVDAHALADLAAEFGDAHFTTFWRADGDFTEAFRNAFGEDLGAWNLRRLQPLMGSRTPGPMPTFAGLLSGMLVVTLCAAVAAGWARRRRVA